MKKFILLIFTLLLFTGCDIVMDRLDVTNGTKYIVTSKQKNIDDYSYSYSLIKIGDKYKWYDYLYKDTADFNVGDTLILNIEKVSK